MMKTFLRFKEKDLYLHHLLNPLPLSESIKNGSSPYLQNMHAHEYFELFYLVSGNCSYIVEGSEYPLTSGCIVLMRPAEVHRLKFKGDTDYERIMLNFEQKLIETIDPKGILLNAYYKRPLGTFNVYKPTDFPINVGRYFLNMTSPDTELDPYERRLTILVNLIPLLSEIHGAFKKKGKFASPNEINLINSELLDYINQNLRENLSLESLGEQFFLSKSQLNRRFRQLTGSTVWEYITAKRLLLAREMILSGVSASQASSENGFKDYSTFFRAYKKKFNATPQSLVKNMSNN